MYFTRPTLKPLNVDLINLEGGGIAPSQFWGKTTDGQSVDVRYRGGRLTISSGTDTLLDAIIGSPLHGAILAEQVCDLAGLTIRGQRPVLSEERRLAAAERADILDWSGCTTYWRRDSFVMTKDAGLEFVGAVQRRVQGCLLLEQTFERSNRRLLHRESLGQSGGSMGFMLLGVPKIPAYLAELTKHPAVRVADIEPAFSRIAYFNFHRDPRFSNFSKTYAEMPDDEHWRGNLRTQHRTGDDEDRSWVEEIVALADRHFPPLIQPSR